MFTVKDNPIASFPSTKLYLDVGRLLFSSFFFTSPRLSSYFLYFIKMSFHHINESQKKTMALLHKRGLNATDIAKDLKVSLSTVSRHLQKMKNDPNYFNKKTFPKNRKPCLDDRGERHLVRAALLSPFKTFTELGRSGVAGRIISRKTVARVLKRHGITKKVARRKPGLKKSCKIARLQFAKAHQSWTISEWNKVLFSDESNFNTRKQSARLKVSRRIGESNTPQNIAYTFSSGTISCSVWGGIAGTQKTNLVFLSKGTTMNKDLYLDVLKHQVLPFMTENNIAIFMQDNAPCHTSKLTKGWLDQQNFLTMKWPPYSPDLNPIEHIWAWIKALLHKKKGHITNYSDLEREIRELWDEVDCAMLEKLFQSMPRRIAAVIDAKGGSIRY